MKIIAVAIVVAIAVAGAYLLLRKQPVPELAVEQQEVVIKNYAFSPTKVVLKKGGKAIWKNEDEVGHTATSDEKGYFDAGALNQGQSSSFKFDKVGTFGYYCIPHPYMRGEIKVVE